MLANEKCGVVGVYSNNSHASIDAFIALVVLQHRGQDSAGIATYDSGIKVKPEMGLVMNVFDETTLSKLSGHIAVGHTRYATEGASKLINSQPLLMETRRYKAAFGFNGNIPYYDRLREKLLSRGFSSTTTTDAEGLAFLLVKSLEKTGGDIFEANYLLGQEVPAAYSYTALVLDKDTKKCQLIGGRDGFGFRPLSYGTIDGKIIIASETTALDQFRIKEYHEINSGGVIRVNENGADIKQVIERPFTRKCPFEDIYFSSAASFRDGRYIYKIREALGELLAEMYPVEADLVLGSPDSGLHGGVGYARRSGIPMLEGIIKNKYIGRTFIMPKQSDRERAASLKFFYNCDMTKGKRVVIVDDSIVRETTARYVVKGLREIGGAKEVHMRITAPPIANLCDFGIAFRTSRELAAAPYFRDNSFENLQEINRAVASEIGADSLGYMSVEGLLKATGRTYYTSCLTCFTAKLPYEITTY